MILSSVCISIAVAFCPVGMAPTGLGTCIDVLPWPNDPAASVRLGVSGEPEHYLDLTGFHDAAMLCAMSGKRMCRRDEWQSACQGTPPRGHGCPPLARYIPPRWGMVASRDPFELSRLNQYPDPHRWKSCRSNAGAQLMGSAQEWIRDHDGRIVMTAGFWSRPAPCSEVITRHSPKWHAYSTGVRCCK